MVRKWVSCPTCAPGVPPVLRHRPRRVTISTDDTTDAPLDVAAPAAQRRAGRTALVTGASAGFGVEFARRLAARGDNLVLVARRAERLESLAAELRATGVDVVTIPLDLTVPDAPFRLADALSIRGITIDVLVNNAGAGTYGPLGEEDPHRIAAEVQLNVYAVTMLCQQFLPQLLASKDGWLVNVTSTAAYQPLPYMAVYAASKAYVRSLTEGLWGEAKGTPLKVIALAPGPTQTEFFQAAGSDRFAIGQQLPIPVVVDTVFRALERRRPPLSVVAGWRNALGAWAAPLVPRRLLVSALAKTTAPEAGAPDTSTPGQPA